MPIAYDQTVKLTISAQTEGNEKVAALAQQVEALGKEGGDAAPKFLALADELKTLASQKVRIDGLETAIAGAKQAWAAVRDARQEVQILDQALADAKGAGASQQAMSLLQGELKAANRELAAAEKAWSRQKDVLGETRTAAAAAGVDTKNLAAEQTRLASALASASQAAAEQQSALEARKAAVAAQTAEEDRLAQIVETTKTRQKLAAQELLAAELKAYAESQAAAARASAAREADARAIEAFSARTKNALADAFTTTGVRSTAAIEADILQVNQALLKLASNAKVSGADFDRAFAAGQARIEVLRAEMDGTGAASSRLAGNTKALAGEFSGLIAQLGGVYLALQVGGMFITANAQAESLARTMTLLTGSSEKAAAEMAYVREAANRLGIEVGDASKSYVQLMAATKDTALEGAGARKVFEAVSGAMATLGKSSSETNDALRAVNQMASKGTVAMEELKGQLGEHLPGAMKAAANGAGLTVAELNKMVESGGVLAEDLLPALAKGLTNMYGVGKANNDTFVAQWARMKNVVTDLFTVVGSGPMKVLNEGLALTTFGAKGVVVAFDFAIGKTKELFGGPQWDSEKARKSLEDVAKNSALLSKALDDASAASSRMGSIIREESNSALQLQSAFDQANDNLGKQIANLEKAAAARKTEADTAARAGQLFDTEIQQRRSAITAAEAHEAALVRVAEQTRFSVTLKETELAKERVMAEQGRKQTQDQIAMTEERIKALEREAEARGTSTQRQKEEVAGLESYLAALKAELLGMGGESEARKKKIEEIEKEIEKRAALADKAQQEAAAAHVATQAAELAAATYADNSKRVGELRAAYEAATVAFERTGEAFVKGIATDKELTASKEAAQRALVLYRDALSDATAAAERHVAAEKSAAGIQQSALQNDLYRANTILEVAKQRGNEKEIAQAQIAVWRIELEISEAQAVAARKEAEAMEIVTKAKRAELEASGGLTEAKKAELALAEAQAKAKQLEAEKYDLVADRMRKLSYETNELKSSFGDLSSSADQAAASADRAAASYDGLASSIRAAGQAKDGWVRNTNGDIVTTGPNVADLAAKYTRTPEQGRIFEEVFNYYYQQASQAPENYSTMQGLQFGAIERAAAAQAAAEAERRTTASATSAPASTQTTVSTPARSTSTPVVMNVNLGSLGTKTFTLDSSQSANTVISVLQELAARS